MTSGVKRLACRLFGHKFRFHRAHFGAVYTESIDVCRRCGEERREWVEEH